MAIHRIRRAAALLSGEQGLADSSPIYIGTDGYLHAVPASTGTTEVVWRPVGSPGPNTTTAVDGAIAITAGTTFLTKGSAAAMTLAAPTVAGVHIVIVADSAFAHVITATGLLDDGVTGGGKNTATFAAFKGSAISLVSTPSLHWGVVSKNLVTIA